MGLAAFKTTEWRKLSAYGRFERVALVAVLLMLGLIIVYALVVAAIKLIVPAISASQTRLLSRDRFKLRARDGPGSSPIGAKIRQLRIGIICDSSMG